MRKIVKFVAEFNPGHKCFLRTDGAGTLPPTCSKLLAQYVCCQAVTDTPPPCFTEKRNVNVT